MSYNYVLKMIINIIIKTNLFEERNKIKHIKQISTFKYHVSCTDGKISKLIYYFTDFALSSHSNIKQKSLVA